MKRNGNAERQGVIIEAPKALRRGGVWGGGIPSLAGEGSGEGAIPRIFFSFLSGNGAFWCILGACFNVSIRRVENKSSVPTANWSVISHGGRIIHDIIHINTLSKSAVSQSDTHAACTMDIVDIHVHATVYLCILLSCILFQET